MVLLLAVEGVRLAARDRLGKTSSSEQQAARDE
jgi:hypothetical protein